MRRGARRGLLALLAAACATLALWSLARTTGAPAAPPAVQADVARGRALFAEGCASCHGLAARGVPGRGPSLRGVGARSADFYLSTGRMPLADPTDAPVRTQSAYDAAEIRALVAYVASFGGPPIPAVHAAAGSLATGRAAFLDHCAGCHQSLARGGIVTGAIAPSLQQASPRQIAEAVRIGPYLMPRFTPREIDRPTLDAIARYVVSTRHPDDAGGWGIGNIGPIPEGMVAWLLAIVALLIVARLIGERAPR
jgi:ubiquinol-cytochrome c reductase cytochrome c subunit